MHSKYCTCTVCCNHSNTGLSCAGVRQQFRKERHPHCCVESGHCERMSPPSTHTHTHTHTHTQGELMAARVFDTYTPGTEDFMVTFLNSLSDGRILCFAILVSCHYMCVMVGIKVSMTTVSLATGRGDVLPEGGREGGTVCTGQPSQL